MAIILGDQLRDLGFIHGFPALQIQFEIEDDSSTHYRAALYVNLPDGRYFYIKTDTFNVEGRSIIDSTGYFYGALEGGYHPWWSGVPVNATYTAVIRVYEGSNLLFTPSDPDYTAANAGSYINGFVAPRANDIAVTFSKIDSSGDIPTAGYLEVLEPACNLGVLQGFSPLSFGLIPIGAAKPYILADTYINLPENRHIHFPQQVIPVDTQSPSTTATVDLNTMIVHDDDGHELGSLWENLDPSTIYSIVVKFAQSSSDTAAELETDGQVQTGQIKADNQSAVCVFVKAPQTDAPSYGLIVTDIGEQKIAQRIANGQKLVITQAGIDDGNGHDYTPQKSQTGLFNEVWRGDIAAAEVDGNTIRTLIVLGASVGNFWARAICLYDEDGDMVAIASIPATQKVASTSGVDFKLKMLLNLIVTDASAIEITVNPILNTVDHEQLQQALTEMTAVFEGDLTGHNNDPAAHKGHFANKSNPHNTGYANLAAAPPIFQEFAYGQVGANNTWSRYTVLPGGFVQGGGFLDEHGSGESNVPLESCGKQWLYLVVSSNYETGEENRTGQITTDPVINGTTAYVKIRDQGSTNLLPNDIWFTFFGRVAM